MQRKLVAYLIDALDGPRVDAEFAEACRQQGQCSFDSFLSWYDRFDSFLLEFYPEVCSPMWLALAQAWYPKQSGEALNQLLCVCSQVQPRKRAHQPSTHDPEGVASYGAPGRSLGQRTVSGRRASLSGGLRLLQSGMRRRSLLRSQDAAPFVAYSTEHNESFAEMTQGRQLAEELMAPRSLDKGRNNSTPGKSMTETASSCGEHDERNPYAA